MSVLHFVHYLVRVGRGLTLKIRVSGGGPFNSDVRRLINMDIITRLETTRKRTLQQFELCDDELARTYAPEKWSIRFVLHPANEIAPPRELKRYATWWRLLGIDWR